MVTQNDETEFCPVSFFTITGLSLSISNPVDWKYTMEPCDGYLNTGTHSIMARRRGAVPEVRANGFKLTFEPGCGAEPPISKLLTYYQI